MGCKEAAGALLESIVDVRQALLREADRFQGAGKRHEEAAIAGIILGCDNLKRASDGRSKPLLDVLSRVQADAFSAESLDVLQGAYEEGGGMPDFVSTFIAKVRNSGIIEAVRRERQANPPRYDAGVSRHNG